MKTAKYFIKRSKDRQYYFVLKAKNGRTILTSEMYKTFRGCSHGITSIQKNGATPVVIIQGDKKE